MDDGREIEEKGERDQLAINKMQMVKKIERDGERVRE